jgi:uncharacterized protein YdeI (YjbR/CyaY-like superfamily)
VTDITDTLIVRDRDEWRDWLSRHHGRERLVWLLIAKKNGGVTGVGYEEAVEEALCFGWIDGQAKRYDERYYALRFTPRRPGSVWAGSNKARVAKLTAEGRMAPAGMAVIDRAKESGDWDSLPTNERLDEIPADLQAALEGDEAAKAAFVAMPASSRRQYVYWITDAKREETRDRRITETVRRAGLGLRWGEPG